MTISIIPDMVDISLCEDTTGWSGVTVATNDAFKKQGNFCLGTKVSETESALIVYTYGSPVDMSDGEHVFMWMQVQGIPDTQANGGMRMYVEDNAGHYGYWNVGGSDNYTGGWFCFVIDPASTPTTGSGTIDTQNILKVGLRFKTLSKALGNNPNCFWDACRYGRGLKITSGPSDAITVDDIFAVDDNPSNCYGVVSKINNVYFMQGKLFFGDVSSGDIDFKDASQLVVFKDNPFVADDFYEVIVQGNSGGTTNFQLGNAAGGSGIQGCIIKSAGTKTFKFTANDTYINVLKLYGCSLLKAGIISLPPNATGREVLNCNFVECGELIADTCIMEYCNFVSSPGRAIRISSASHNVTNCNFISCQTAIHHDVGGSSGTPLEYDYDTLMFSGNTYDIENSATSPDYYIDIDRINGSNPNNAKILNSNGGTTVLLAISVHLYLTGLVVGSEIEILEAGTQNELAHEESSETSYDYQYYYAEGVYIDIVVHKEDYEWYFISNYGPLPQNNASIPISQRKDRVYKNP